jgi:hypothetical protein
VRYFGLSADSTYIGSDPYIIDAAQVPVTFVEPFYPSVIHLLQSGNFLSVWNGVQVGGFTSRDLVTAQQVKANSGQYTLPNSKTTLSPKVNYLVYGPKVVSLGTNPATFVVTFHTSQYQLSNYDVAAGIYYEDNYGVVKAQWKVNTNVTTGSQQSPTIAKLTNSSFVIVWSDSPSAGIFGIRYDFGIQQGTFFQVNTRKFSPAW